MELPVKKRIVSFSLFGSAPLYLEGAIRNAELVPSIYPGWLARMYVSHEIPDSYIARLENAGAQVIVKQRRSLIDGMFWRFLPAGEVGIDAVVVRDVDSRLTHREFSAVEEWIDSGLSLHIMRDHPLHKVPVLGGAWGCRGTSVPDMAQLIDRWNLWAKKGQDQDFLRDVIYPRFRRDCMVHSDFFQYAGESAKPFPWVRNRGEFVGCVYDPNSNELTEAQHKLHLTELKDSALQRLPRVKRHPKFYLVAEQWLRNLRKRVA